MYYIHSSISLSINHPSNYLFIFHESFFFVIPSLLEIMIPSSQNTSLTGRMRVDIFNEIFHFVSTWTKQLILSQCINRSILPCNRNYINRGHLTNHRIIVLFMVYLNKVGYVRWAQSINYWTGFIRLRIYLTIMHKIFII